MAAFERVLSGIPALDTILDNIRMGDNVVWRVSDLDEFRIFADPYVEQAKKDGRKIIYFRFASHPELVAECPEVKRVCVPLSHRFETFTVEIHNVIEQEGKDAFYVFDCLSELQTAWATDLMMGNFFRVTCPFLFILDTVAFFPIIRGRHSYHAIAKISDTTQLFLDVYSDSSFRYGAGAGEQPGSAAGEQASGTGETSGGPMGDLYIRPEKVWNRYSDTMFLPHIYHVATGEIQPILDGVQASHFYQVLNSNQRTVDEQYTDSWDRFFNMARMMHDNNMPLEEQCSRMCNIMMTRDGKMRELVKKHFVPEDYFQVRDHMIGTGMIGGKACGMLLARAIIRNTAPDIDRVLEPHDSFFVGSDVYYTYIVDNDFWDIRIRQRTEEEYFELADTFAEHLKSGKFSQDMREQFMHILEYYGQDPYIVRSSSILEDGFENAFAGKYESVFCANRGTMEERLEEFENAVKTVYASTMGLSALDYRKRRGLDKRDEQMALLIMRVSGSVYGQYYMPCAAGVGYSFSPYKFLKNIDPAAGMLRLVMGLGTSAVDRKEGSYPRLVSLDMPEATSCTTIAQKHQFSQRKAEAVDMKGRCLKQVSLDEMEPLIPDYLKKYLLEHDYEVESNLRERGIYTPIWFISCLGLVKHKEIMERMQRMMQLIQKEYDYPVDIEFTMNISASGEYMINLLQCRPLQVFQDKGTVRIPEAIPAEEILLESRGASMGLSREVPIDMIVYVDPVAYYNLPYASKPGIARLIGAINWKYREQGKHMILMVPGRIGTSSPELGVPTAFSDISEFEAVCEIAEDKAGYNPELSYGSHIFQDLVESQILYTAVFPGEKTIHYAPEKLKERENLISGMSGGEGLEDVIYMVDTSGSGCMLYHDLADEHLVLTLS